MTVLDSIAVSARPTLRASGPEARPKTPAPVVRVLLAWVFAFVVFAPSIVRSVAAPRVIVTILAVATIVHESARVSAHASRIAQFVVVPYVVLSTIALTALHLGAPNSFNIQRLIIVTPVCLAMGYLTAKNGGAQTWARAFVGVGVVNASLAMLEVSVGRSLLGRTTDFALNERDGGVRALLGAEHSLVLGAILAACVPLVGAARIRMPFVIALVLVAGSWATGSRGPTVLALVVTVTYVFPGAAIFLKKRYRKLVACATGLVVTVAAMSIFVWQPVAAGELGTSYSTNYRAALYSELPRILASHPFGYGFGGLPSNTWLIDSRLFGVQDVATTIDSEVVLSASNFGIVGVAAFLAMLFCGLLAVRSDAYLALGSVIVSLTGLFLALHAWDSLGPLWYFLTGIAAFLVRASRAKRDDRASPAGKRITTTATADVPRRR
jgi:hypothetical protein